MSRKFEQFSVSMCVYGGDRPDWFRTAVDSVLYQTVPPDEVVLVVDGPVPETLDGEIRRCETMPVFRVTRLPENRGHGEARRAGLSSCSFDLVALMDADDISLPDRFEKQLQLFSEDPQLAAAGGLITEFVDSPENIVGLRTVEETDAAIKRDLKSRCPMNQVAVMLRRSMAEAVGGYLDWYCNEDYYLWARMCLADMRFANVPEVLVNVRVGREMYQRRGGKRYFASEAKLQKFLLENGLIGRGQYLVNIAKRLVVQVLLPNRLRSWVFRRFARKSAA